MKRFIFALFFLSEKPNKSSGNSVFWLNVKISQKSKQKLLTETIIFGKLINVLALNSFKC